MTSSGKKVSKIEEEKDEKSQMGQTDPFAPCDNIKILDERVLANFYVTMKGF